MAQSHRYLLNGLGSEGGDSPSLLDRSHSRSGGWHEEDSLALAILDDSPKAIISSINESIVAGATAEQLGAAVAHAAFLRMAHFHTSNEFRDWDTVHNTLTAANGLHQALKRVPSPELLRGVYDVAMSIYLDRFLNLPPMPLPAIASNHESSTEILGRLLDMVNVRHQVEESAKAVSDYLAGDGHSENLMSTMGRIMLREDADFHSFQILDAAFKQFASRKCAESARHVMIGLSRFLAAHSPTPRAEGQTFQIALRLQRGEEIYR